MGGLRMGKPLNAAAGPNAADFANSIWSFLRLSADVNFPQTVNGHNEWH
jgi:hypothetical protein